MKKNRSDRYFISADMEGIAGVNDWKDVDNEAKGDYDYFRKLMTQEVNAAIEGCIESGASEVVVRDAHGNALNLLPLELHPESRLIRQWSDSPYEMMDGISSDFKAAIFIGYHAKAGTPNAVLKHTFTDRFHDIKVNGISMAEAGFNALIAGHFNVPLICVAGDKAICEYSQTLIPNIRTAPVKEGIQRAAIHLHPEKARALIKTSVKEAISGISSIQPFQMTAPLKVEIRFSHENHASKASWYPGVRRVDHYTIRFRTTRFEDMLAMLFFIGQ